MKKLIYKIKPKSGISHVFYYLFNIMQPILVLLLVLLHLPILAAGIILLAKWRMFAVRPRYWLANIRANLVDIFVGLAVVAFVAGTSTWYTQLFWTLVYIVWLVWLKPKSKPIPVMAQALVAQALALVAFYRAFPSSSILLSIIIIWLICYVCARHFLGAFEEPLIKVISNLWAWFGATMAWVLGHWSIEYLFLPQIALILSVLGYGLAAMYYLESKNKLKPLLRFQLIVVLILILLIIIVFSDWQDKTI